MYDEILYEVDAPVATITLNRPERLNAWTPHMGDEVRHAVAAATADADVVGIVLTGAGRGFCAGADLRVLADIGDGAPGAGAEGLDADLAVELAVPPELEGTYGYLLACPKPIIAAINGPIAGMAVPIALHCDVRYMAEDAVLMTAFAERGLIAEWAIGWLLTRLAGPAVAMDLLLSSRKVDGTEAARLGLVNEALPRDQVVDRARAWITDAAARCSPASLAIMKQQVWADLHRSYAESAAESFRLMLESFRRPDFDEGVQSFLERRPPTFARLTAPRPPDPALAPPPT